MLPGMDIAADSRRFSATLGLRRRRVLMRWAWIWVRSLSVLHWWRRSVLGLLGNCEMEMMEEVSVF